MGLTGTWINVYGSKMQLWQSDDGEVVGIYSSTTGSTGRYYVWGFMDPQPSDTVGQSVSLSIYWKSIDGGTGDPSWHYVSGLSGQLVTVSGTPNLILIHNMVSTDVFPGEVPYTGNFLDKLVYTPSSTQAGKAPVLQAKAKETPSPINGVWKCTQIPGLILEMALQDAQYGILAGIQLSGGSGLKLVGFADPDAVGAGLNLQGVTLSGLDPVTQMTFVFSGSLDLKTGNLSLLQMKSEGTDEKSTWVQTLGTGLDFTKAS